MALPERSHWLQYISAGEPLESEAGCCIWSVIFPSTPQATDNCARQTSRNVARKKQNMENHGVPSEKDPYPSIGKTSLSHSATWVLTREARRCLDRANTSRQPWPRKCLVWKGLVAVYRAYDTEYTTAGCPIVSRTCIIPRGRHCAWRYTGAIIYSGALRRTVLHSCAVNAPWILYGQSTAAGRATDHIYTAPAGYTKLVINQRETA